MSKSSQKNLLFFLGIISVIVSLYVGVSLGNIKEHYHSMAILPFVYGISLIFLSRCQSLNVFKTVAICTYSVKLLITPWFLTTIGGRELQTGIKNAVYDHIFEAVLLQVIEILAVTVFLYNIKDKNISHFAEFSVTPHRKTWSILKLLCFITIVFVYLYPQFLYKFQPVFFSDQDAYIAQQVLSSSVRGSMNVYLYNIALWIVPLTKLLLVYMFIYIIYKYSNGGTRLSLLLSLLVVFISCLFTSSDRAATIYTGIVGLLLIHKLYVSYQGFISRFSIIFAVGGIFFIFLYNAIFKAEDSMAEVGYKLNAYFSGTLNVAACFEMNDSNLFNTFMGDILRNIPLVMGFFVRLPMSYLEFNKALAYDDVYNSQILPVIGQGYYYFNVIGVVLFPILMFKVAYFFYNHIRYARDSFEYFAYMVALIYTFLGVNLYDMFLTMGLVMQYGLPMFAICIYSYINNKRKYE